MPAVIFITRVLRMVLQHRGTVFCHYIKQRKRSYMQIKSEQMSNTTTQFPNVENVNIKILFCLAA